MENKDLIQSYIFTAAKYNFSVYEQRILVRIVESFQHILEGQKLNKNIEIDEDLWGDFHFTMPLSQFMSNSRDKNYHEARKALENLEGRKLTYESEGNWGILRLIQSPKIEKYEMATFRIDKKISEVLFDFSKGFTKYELKVAMELSSVYSVRLYELMSNQKNKISYSIENLKKMFGIEDKYKQTGHFITRVIEPAKKELDKKAPWSFDYKYLKTGRKITGILFSPIFIPENRDKELEKRELNKRLSPTWDIPGPILEYLRLRYEFTDKEIKNNYKILIPASNDGSIDLLEILSLKYREAMDKKSPKGWIISVITKEYAQAKIKRG